MQDTLLNLIPGACSPEVHLSQYDKGRVVPFKLADGKSAYDVPAGSAIVVKATKPSGLGFIVPVSFEGDMATMTITETMSNEYGRFPAELSITNGDTLIGTANFVLNVERSPHPEGTTDGDAETLIPELTLLVNEIRESNAKVESMTASASPLQSGSNPTAEYDSENNNLAFGIPSGEKGDKGDKGDTGAKGDKGDKGDTGDVSLAQLEEILSDYALQNGYYDELTAGSAEQLLSSQFVEDSVPYKFRTSGGSADIGNREYDEIVGGSIVWNQLQPLNGLPATQTIKGVTLTNNGDGSVTLSGTNTGSSSAIFSCTTFPYTIPVGHKVLLTGASGMNWGGPFTVYDSGTGSLSSVKTSGGNVYNKTGTYTKLDIAVWAGSTVNVRFYPIVCDLTQMFGSQIADYIYSLETAQSGKGVAFFKSLFPNDYYPYNAGELLSVEGLQSHDTVGFNQWDEEWENGIYDANGEPMVGASSIRSKNYIRVLPNVAYCLTNLGVDVYATLCYYDEDKTFISGVQGAGGRIHNGSVFTTPSNAQYMRFALPSYGATYKNDICINLSWSGWRNGEYEPYKKYSYPLDSSLTLRGIPKVVDNEFCFDGDSYKYNGGVGRRFAEVDMGSLNWSRTASYTRGVFYVNLTGAKINSYNTDSNLLNVKYTATTRKDASELATAGDKLICLNGGTNQLLVTDDSYTTANAFKTAMSGVKLIYELATPTEETAEPFDEIQLVDDFGTEEYVSGNLVPVGHNTKYPANLRDKLQHLPDLPSGDGFYLIQVSGTQMTLNPFRIPMMPTTDGTYTLKCTVSGGTPAASWVMEGVVQSYAAGGVSVCLGQRILSVWPKIQGRGDREGGSHY